MTPTTLAVFDLDHTLASRDTFVWYLGGFLLLHPLRLFRCVTLPVAVARFIGGLIDNRCLKEVFISSILGGVKRSELEAWTRVFLNLLVPRGLLRDGLRVVEVHRRAGHHLVLLTASPDCYVDQLGVRLGFHEVICTRLQWREARVSGRIEGQNMRGEEKAKELIALKERYKGCRVVAYADSPSDMPMLELADSGVLVNANASTRTVARAKGLTLQKWS